LAQQFEVNDLVGFHEYPVGKRAATGAAGLISQQLDRAVEDSMIVWFENALFAVVKQPNQTPLFDRGQDPWNRL